MNRICLISGVAGMDGATLCEHLLNLGNYEIHGIVRRHSAPETQDTRLVEFGDKITTHYGDVKDTVSLNNLVSTIKPDEFYHLAAQSFVKASFEIPQDTVETNAIGTLNVIESLRLNAPNCRMYNACSSEQYGNEIEHDGFQRETTSMSPVSPYGCSKLFAYSIARNYRHSYGMWIANGILFNHSGPRRGLNFVTQKVTKTAVEIFRGNKKKLALGNLDACRDWGSSDDYVKMMVKMLQHDKPDDFVVASGRTVSVRYLCDYAFSKLGMNYLDHVVVDPRFYRPEELKYLKGDSSKAKTILGWEPQISFEQMIDRMIDFWLKQIPEVHPTQSWHCNSGI